MVFTCLNPKCFYRSKVFKSFRALAAHTANSATCSNYMARQRMQSGSTKSRENLITNVHEIAARTNHTNNSIADDSFCFDENEEPPSMNNVMHIDRKHQWTIMLLKILDDINAPDNAFKEIIKWAKEAYDDGYTFDPIGGLSRKNNIAQIRKMYFQSEALLPKIETVNIPHGVPSEIVTFDFVPQLLCLLQNPNLMRPEHLAIDFYDPLLPYQSVNGRLNEALSGSVYQSAYSKFVKDPTKDFFVPIIQWIDRTHITGNERYSLKPYMFTPAIFKE